MGLLDTCGESTFYGATIMNKPRSSSHSNRQSSYTAKRDALAQNPAFDKMVADFEKTLREIARHQRQKEHYCTMSTTDIVSEAYMRLRRNVPTGIEDIAVFKAAATVIMREILIDAARRRKAEKRGGGLSDLRVISLKG